MILRLPVRLRTIVVQMTDKKMKKIVLSLVGLVMCAALSAQSSDPVIMKINGVAVPRSEFEYSYNKNNVADVIDKKTVEEYVELFVNYKLKVCEALAARLDTAASFKREYRMYRDQQVIPTIVTDADMLVEARNVYNRYKEQVGSKDLLLLAHIVIGVSTKATPAEQERAKARIDSVYRALKAGADFGELAKKVSDDKRTGSQGGQLPRWVGTGQTFKEIEDVSYTLQPGQFSQPLLSPVGWHIILMKGRKQLEPFDSLKAQILKNIEQQGVRERISDERVQQVVDRSNGTLTSEQVMDNRADSLATASKEMKYLMQEYHDGLLLYEISKRQVWDKAANDEAGLEAYFKDHKKDYVWDSPRFKGMAYHVKDKNDIKAVKKSVKRLPFDKWTETLRTTFNRDSVKRIQVQIGIFKAGDNGLVDSEVFKVPTKASMYAKGVSPEEYPYSDVFGKKLKRPETYQDVRNLVVADYQDMLEKAWIYELRQRYSVSVNQEVLKTVNKHQ